MKQNKNSRKRKHVLVQSELNKLTEKVKLISGKGLTKKLRGKYSI